MNRDIEQI